jgi:hypothetical protein
MKTDGNGWENHSSFLCSHFVTRNGNGSGNRIARSRDDMGYTDRSKQVNMGGNSTETEEYRTHIDSRVRKFTLYITVTALGSQITSSHTTLTTSQISRVTAHRKHTTTLNTWTATVHISQHCIAGCCIKPHTTPPIHCMAAAVHSTSSHHRTSSQVQKSHKHIS